MITFRTAEDKVIFVEGTFELHIRELDEDDFGKRLDESLWSLYVYYPMGEIICSARISKIFDTHKACQVEMDILVADLSPRSPVDLLI